MRYDVWATVRDPGEMAGMLPVVRYLRRSGVSVRLLATGYALNKLYEDSWDHWDATDVRALLKKHDPPRLLLATTAYQGGAGRDLIPMVRDTTTTVLLQSLWGGFAGWGPQHQPDYVITNDHMAEGMIRTLWPTLAAGAVYKTGFPMLDQYAGFDLQAEARQAREMLRLNHNPTVVFAGQSDATSAMLSELIEVLNPHRNYINFAPRPHPRMRTDYPAEAALWDKALTNYRGELVVNEHCSMRQMVALAYNFGAVVSMYSTALLEAAAARTSAVAMLYPEAEQAFRKENPGLGFFPLVALGCAAHVVTRDDLTHTISTAIARGNIWRGAQEQHITTDGQNARRAAGVVISLLN